MHCIKRINVDFVQGAPDVESNFRQSSDFTVRYPLRSRHIPISLSPHRHAYIDIIVGVSILTLRCTFAVIYKTVI